MAGFGQTAFAQAAKNFQGLAGAAGFPHTLHGLKRFEASLRRPTIFPPLGGGPRFFMAPPPEEPSRWLALAASVRSIPSTLPQKPKAVVVISAHWEEQTPTILMTERPGLLFDYDRFPPETDRLTSPAPGAPGLGDHVRDLLLRPGIDYGSDKARDYARGIFVPFKVGLPEADIPILQISPEAGMDRARHMAIGRASPPLRDKNVLIVGGGLSFHNRSTPGDPRAAAPSQAFDEWLPGILCTAPISERFAHRAQWDAAPLTRICRPSEVHRLPRMLAAGAAPGEPGRQVLSRKAWGKAISAYQYRTSNQYDHD